MSSAIDNTGYYTIIGVNKTATPAEIKRSYYIKARACHPDKNPDNPAAEAQFKELSEAYQVLSDPEKRGIYDKYGKDGLGGLGSIDPVLMFNLLFGGPVMFDLVGNMTAGHVLKFETDPEFVNLEPEAQKKKVQDFMEKETIERVAMLKYKLLIRLEPYVSGGDLEAVISADLEQKLEAPGAPAILTRIAYVYGSEARKKLKRFFGLGSIAATLHETGHNISQTWKVLKTAVHLQATNSKMEALDQEEDDGTKQSKQAELEEKMKKLGLSALWRVGEMEIESITRMVCREVLHDKSTTSDIRKKRAEALEKIEALYEKSAKKLYKGHSATIEAIEKQTITPEAASAASSSNNTYTTNETATSSNTDGNTTSGGNAHAASDLRSNSSSPVVGFISDSSSEKASNSPPPLPPKPTRGANKSTKTEEKKPIVLGDAPIVSASTTESVPPPLPPHETKPIILGAASAN